MLLILPLWTWLVACGLAGVAVVGYPVPVDRGCDFRKNSGPHQSIGLLAMLTDLFREKLMTESNEKTYYVSICRRLPLNGSTSLAGAVQYNSKGKYVVLGEIDQAETAVVNEKSIVLTYIGSEINRNLNKDCNGNRWKTYLTFICNPYAMEDTLKLVDKNGEQSEICQIKFEILTSKVCRWNSSVVRIPIVQYKYNNFPLVMTSSDIANTQYNNSSTNNIVSDANKNNLKNYRHGGLVYIQNNSNQHVHQDDSNNYIREVYHKRRLLMNTDILTPVKQPSQNLSREIEEMKDEQTINFVKFILSFIPKPIFVVVMVLWSLYEWLVNRKSPKPEQKNEENTPLMKNVTYNQFFFIIKEERQFSPPGPPMAVSGKYDDQKEADKQKEKDEKYLFLGFAKISKRFWTVIGVLAVAITMLILQIPWGNLILCLLWIWFVLALCKPGQKKKKHEENDRQGKYDEEIGPPVLSASTDVNYEQNKSAGTWISDQTEDAAKVSGESKIQKGSDELVLNIGKPDGYQIRLDKGDLNTGVADEDNDLGLSDVGLDEKTVEEKSEFIVVAKVDDEVKDLHHHWEKDEKIASRWSNGSTAVHVEQNSLASAGIVKRTEDTTDHVSSESKISKESDVHVSKENGLGELKMDS